MLELLNKLISGAKEKLTSAWNWVKSIFTSEKAIVKNDKVATIVVSEEDEVTLYSKSNVEDELKACDHANDIINKDLTVDNFESVVDDLYKSVKGYNVYVNVKLILLHGSVIEKLLKFYKGNKDSLGKGIIEKLNYIENTRAEIKGAHFVSEDVFNKSLYSSDKIVTAFVVVVEEKK